MVETYQCPFCGANAEVGRPCPGCVRKRGRRKRRKQAPPPAPKPWEQDEGYDALDLPDGEFDHDEFVRREFGRLPHRSLRIRWYWWALGVAVVVMVLAMAALNLR